MLARLLIALGINSVPAAGFLAGAWPAELTMLLYLCENLTMTALAALKVSLFGGPGRRSLLSSFLLVSLGFSFVTSAFVLMFVFAILRADIRSEQFLQGLTGIAAFQLIGFIYDFFALRPRPLPTPRAEAILEQALGRVFLLSLAVFAGVVVALFADRWFVIPFIVLKTIVDVGTALRRV